MKAYLDSMKKKLKKLETDMADAVGASPVGETYKSIQNTKDKLEQAKIDMFSDGFYNMGFGNAVEAKKTSHDLTAIDSVEPLQGLINQAGIHNPAAAMLTPAGQPPSQELDPSRLEMDLLPEFPPVVTSSDTETEEIRTETERDQAMQEAEARRIEANRIEMERINQEVERKQNLQKEIEGAKRVEEMLLASGLLRDRDEDEKVSQIGAAAPILLS